MLNVIAEPHRVVQYSGESLKCLFMREKRPSASGRRPSEQRQSSRDDDVIRPDFRCGYHVLVTSYTFISHGDVIAYQGRQLKRVLISEALQHTIERSARCTELSAPLISEAA